MTVLRKEDFTECLRGVLSGESGDNLLHVAAAKGHADVVTVLLEAGCDPTHRNRRKFVPYVVSNDKNTKQAFKDFVARNSEFPYDIQQVGTKT